MIQSVGIDAKVEQAVGSRYTLAAQEPAPGLCCPTEYDPVLLAVIPPAVLQRDYGCGNPTKYLREGETVLDLGCGAGKICFLAAQVVGRKGFVIGVDMNDQMLAIARESAPLVAEQLGYANVSFRKGRIQDLALDLELLDAWLTEHPVSSSADLVGLEAAVERLRSERPLVESGSVDVVISNCVLNLVAPAERTRLFREIVRVLRPGGRAVISDIVASSDVAEAWREDPELWSGCISGAWREDLFVQEFQQAGMYGTTIVERPVAPWRIIDGIEFRSLTVVAYKPASQQCCTAENYEVMYRGPFCSVVDEDGHVLPRGKRVAVCRRTYEQFGREPYRAHVELIPPPSPPSDGESPPAPSNMGPRRRDQASWNRGSEAEIPAATPATCPGPSGKCCG